MATGTATPTIADRFAAAFKRACEQRLVAYKIRAGMYEVPSNSRPGEAHIVTFYGPAWSDWACTCAGGNHSACTHRAVAAYAVRHGFSAKRPAPATCAEIRETFAAGAAHGAAARAAIAEAHAIVNCPGYLALHTPAAGSNVETFTCAVCETTN